MSLWQLRWEPDGESTHNLKFAKFSKFSSDNWEWIEAEPTPEDLESWPASFRQCYADAQRMKTERQVFLTRSFMLNQSISGCVQTCRFILPAGYVFTYGLILIVMISLRESDLWKKVRDRI